MAEVAWAGNARERAAKKRGWGFYASHIGSPELGWVSNHEYLDAFPARAEWRDLGGEVFHG